MIVQFKEGFLEALKEYGSGIRLTTAYIGDSYRKFESLWSNGTLTFTINGEGEGPIVVYYSDYNDNKIDKAFILGTYTPETAPLREKVYIEAVVNEEDGLMGNFPYEGTISPSNLYLATKIVNGGGETVIQGETITDKEKEDIILGEINYFNIHFPEEVNANILSTYSDKTIKFLEDPYQVEGCNIFTCSSGIPTKESYEKHYRRQIISKNTNPIYLDPRGEKVYSSITYKDYKKLFIQALDIPSVDSTYYVGNSKSVEITGSCIYDMYRVENGIYTLVEKDCVEGIDVSSLEGVSGNGYSISGKTITFDISSNIEKSSFQAIIKFRDEVGNGSLKKIESNIITFITYLGWSVEYSSNLKEDDGNIVFLFDYQAGSRGLERDARITLYSDADVPVESILLDAENPFFDYFDFEVRKDTNEISEQHKYVVDISTRQTTEINGNWFPIVDGNSGLILCTLKISGSSDQIHFYCVQRARYPLEISGVLGLSGIGAKISGDMRINGLQIDEYSNWDYEIDGDSTLIDLSVGKSIGESFNIINCKNPSAISDKIKFFRVGPSGEVLPDSWKDVMYCYDDNNITYEVVVDGESLGTTPYFYNNKPLFIFERGDKTPQEFNLNGSGDVSTNEFFNITWINDKVSITAKDSIQSKSSWYPKDNDGKPIEITLGDTSFYCVVAPDLSETINIIDQETLELINSVNYKNKEIEKNLYITAITTTEFDYWIKDALDSRVSMYLSRYINGYGIPFTEPGGMITTLSNSFEVTNSRDIVLEPFIIKRVAGRYTNSFEMLSDWRNQLTRSSKYELPISMVGKDPSESLKISVYNPDGTSSEIEDDDFLELSYIGLYKLFIRSESTYRISLKGIDKNNQYIYFFNTLTSSKREGVLSIDRGSFDVMTGEEICFAFYGGEPGSYQSAEQILDAYIQVEDLLTGSTINIRLKRIYPDNNIRKINPIESDIILGNENFEISFNSNVETNIGEPQFSNNLFTNKGTITRKLVTSDIWTRGYEGHRYILNKEYEIPSYYPISPVDKLEIINPEKFNNESAEYNIYKLAPAPEAVVGKQILSIPYLANADDSVFISVRQDAKYKLFFIPNGDSTERLEITGDRFDYEDENLRIYKSGEDTWTVEDTSGVKYGDRDTPDNYFYGTLVIKPYIEAVNFINGRVFSQEEVDSLVRTNEKSIAIYRLCQSKSISSIDGARNNISKLGETRTFECNFITDNPVRVESSLAEQSVFIESMSYDNGSLSVKFKSRLSRHNYSSIQCTSSNIANVVTNYSGEDEGCNFYLYEGDEKVMFEGLYQDKWERAIRICGPFYIGGSSGNAYLGAINNMGSTYLDYNDNTITIYVSSIELPKSTSENFDRAVEQCTVTLSGGGTVSTGSLRSSSTNYGYQTTLSLPQNNSISDTTGPYVLTITDSYGNSVTKTFYKSPKNSFNVYLTDSDHISGSTVNGLVTETAFSASGKCLHPSTLYLITDAPSVSSFSAYGVARTSIGYSNSPTISISSGGSATSVTYNSRTYNAYPITLTNKINTYYQSGSSFNPLASYGHIVYDTSIYLGVYCNGATSYTSSILSHHGYCEISLLGPYKTYLANVGGTISHPVNFATTESTEETSKYAVGSYFTSNTKPTTSSYSTYYQVDNKLYVNYSEKDPKKYNTDEIPFRNYGYYSGFGLNIVRKEYVYSGGSWSVNDFKVHTVRCNETLMRYVDNASLMQMQISDSETITVPRYWFVDTLALTGDSAHTPGTTTADGVTTLHGLLYEIPASQFTNSGNKYTISKNINVSTKGINDDTITFTVNFEIYLS